MKISRRFRWLRSKDLGLSRSQPLAKYVPPGRTLHLIDLENLCSGPDRILEMKRAVAIEYCHVARVISGDHIVIGVNPNSYLKCVGLFPGSRLVGGHGPDGADEALLQAASDISWVVSRYERVVIGSGDHCFSELAAGLTAKGIRVGLVAPATSISKTLAGAAGFRLPQREEPLRQAI